MFAFDGGQSVFSGSGVAAVKHRGQCGPNNWVSLPPSAHRTLLSVSALLFISLGWYRRSAGDLEQHSANALIQSNL